MRTADFSYHLPPALIAHHPAPHRDASRLLVLHRSSRQLEHRKFPDLLNYLRQGDLLVLNNSRVIPARLRARKSLSGGSVEILLVEELQTNSWWVMLKPGKRVRPGTVLRLNDLRGETTDIEAVVQEKNSEGQYKLQFTGVTNLKNHLDTIGEIPLPPYIERPAGPESADSDRYQTVFARPPGSVAAPTAGLHFTPQLLERIQSAGVPVAEVTLHVGLGTFAPVKVETLEKHVMHEERYEISEETAQRIRETKQAGGRVIAVGTTTLRVLESVAAAHDKIVGGGGKTRLFVFPPYSFRVVDGLLTNFHLPESTLLMLVSAFAAPGEVSGREIVLEAYAEAVREKYRFFSYGDAMLIL